MKILLIALLIILSTAINVKLGYCSSGHGAGYEWAEMKGIDDPDDCSGNSQSFIEGCQSYAEEQESIEDEDEEE